MRNENINNKRLIASKDKYLGKKFTTTEGLDCVIIDYKGNSKVTVLFKNGFICTTNIQAVKKGHIKNYLFPSVYGYGYVGIGKYKVSHKGKITKLYDIWRGVIKRVYDKKYHHKKPTYKGCSVAEEWHNFQNFAEWMEQNYNPETMEGWHLDKDILVRGNKVYSPETCCFVPQEINSIFKGSSKIGKKYPEGVTLYFGKYKVNLCIKGVQKYLGTYNTIEEAFQCYKIAKEAYIKEVADEWRDKIDPQVYQTMCEYKI